jgi:mRNA-degrading endonuclease RelE of RelBE toxin-antitoxin system
MEIKYSKQASKYLARLSLQHKRSIVMKIKKLPDGDVQPMKNDQNAHRLRVGGHRVLFDILPGYIFIGKIKPRGDIYK